jgi:putative addiction module component (TIGR02574 family)
MSTLLELVSNLTPSERLDLIEFIWDSLNDTEEPKLTNEQAAELDSRIAAMTRGELKTDSLEDVLTKIRDGSSP